MAIDASAGVASAKVNANGTVFQFKANGPASLPTRLTPGQAVYANFRNGQVSLDGRRVCCQIVPEAAVPSPVVVASIAGEMVSVSPGSDNVAECCVVTGVDLRSGIMSGRDLKTGYTFKFIVRTLSGRDSANVVREATIGHKIWADLHGKGVKMEYSRVCCMIIEESDH